MYLFMDDNKYLVPAYDISYVDGPLYKVVVSREDSEHIWDIRYITDNKIFKVDLKELMQLAVQSMNIKDVWGSQTGINLTPIEGRDVSCNIAYGALIYTIPIRGFATQLIFPDNVLSIKDIIAVADEASEYSRIKVMPRDGWKNTAVTNEWSTVHYEVLNYLKKNGPSTAYTIADGIDRPLTSVTGRISELSKAGLIVCYDYDYSTGRKRNMWYFKSKDEMEGLYV